MHLYVLAGGKGTRLSGEIGNLPKTLAPINGVPFLDIQLKNWISQGVQRISLLLYHKAESIIGHVESIKTRNNLYNKITVDYIVEPKELGTGGSIANLCTNLPTKNNVVICNADTWISNGITKIGRKSENTLAVKFVEDTARYGAVKISEGKITEFTEKNGFSLPGYVSVGLCSLNPSIFKSWNGEAFSLEKTTLPNLAKKHNLSALDIDCNFIDIGIPEDYHRFIDLYKSIEKRPK